MTAVEVGPDIPYEVLLKPDCSASVDGIDFVYSEQSRCLSTTIRFTKVVVHDEHVATSRIASAEVLCGDSIWFYCVVCTGRNGNYQLNNALGNPLYKSKDDKTASYFYSRRHDWIKTRLPSGQVCESL